MTTYILTANAFREIYEYQLKNKFSIPLGQESRDCPHQDVSKDKSCNLS